MILEIFSGALGISGFQGVGKIWEKNFREIGGLEGGAVGKYRTPAHQ